MVTSRSVRLPSKALSSVPGIFFIATISPFALFFAALRPSRKPSVKTRPHTPTEGGVGGAYHTEPYAPFPTV